MQQQQDEEKVGSLQKTKGAFWKLTQEEEEGRKNNDEWRPMNDLPKTPEACERATPVSSHTAK
jgi:hypothetical protein